MVETLIRQTSRQSWYRMSVYVYVILFAIVGIMIYFLTIHSMSYYANGQMWRWIAVDLVILTVALVFILVQFFRNLFTIIRRSL